MQHRCLLTVFALCLITTSWAQEVSQISQNTTPAEYSTVTGTSGEVHARPDKPIPQETTVIIRCGHGTIQKGPLYVVDGVITDKETALEIPAENIGSIDVLKDIAASAIYGSRGSDGVILIRTKQEPVQEFWQNPSWFRLRDQLFFRLDERETILKIAVVTVSGAIVHEQVGYDAEDGVLLEDLPRNKPLFLLLTTARGRTSWRMQWSDQ